MKIMKLHEIRDFPIIVQFLRLVTPCWAGPARLPAGSIFLLPQGYYLRVRGGVSFPSPLSHTPSPLSEERAPSKKSFYGAEINVPLFVNEGDKIKVDTEKGVYIERIKE